MNVKTPMIVDELVIPELLQAMLAESRWPRDAHEAMRQNLRSLVPEDRIRRLRRIFLYPPPFHTVAQLVDGGNSFYSRFGALHELVPNSAIEIADWGAGTDAPILLDYRVNPANPSVILLEWPGDDDLNRWVVMHHFQGVSRVV